MKKTYLFLCLSFVFGISVLTSAQVAPDAATLKHQWTFDDGTANDSKGTLNGVLEGNAVIKDKALNTSSGGFLTLNATDLAINNYPELTTEVWFTSVAAANTSYHMLYYFGDTNGGGGGENYTCITPARGNNVSRAMLSTGTGGSGAENGVNGPEYDDGVLHHMVSVISGTSITFYIDGNNMGSADLTGTNSIAGIGTQYAYFAKGGYAADPTWKGKIHKISVFDAALTDDNIQYLFQHGAEEQPVISASASSFLFDSNANQQDITVTGANLSAPITITVPAGITVSPASIPANITNAPLSVIYDGVTAVDGVITLTSGTVVVTIPVKGISDATCFVPLYSDITNLIIDPGMNSQASYSGWGTKEILTIESDPTNVYCGTSSIKVGNGLAGGSGSLDYHLDGMLYPNTTYRVKVMVKTTDGPFNLGLERLGAGTSTILKVFDTNGEWQAVDFTFVTGTDVVNPVMYINNYQLSGKTVFVDNWELYPSPDQSISTTKSSLGFDPEHMSSTFNVTASNLLENIIVSAPAGITVSATTLPYDAASTTVTVSFDGSTVVDGTILLTSGSTTASLAVKSTTTSNLSCFTPLYADKINLISDPYMNDEANFAGWGTNDFINIADKADSVYCGSNSGRILGRASIDVHLAGLLVPNYNYIARAMFRTFGGAIKMGINGYDDAVNVDYVDSINTDGVWAPFTFEFHTGEIVKADPVIFINNDGTTGKYGYFDNWELYQKDPYVAGIAVIKDQFENLYVQNGKIVADFDLDYATTVQLTVYNIQGAMVSDQKIAGMAGRNTKTVNSILPSGMYMVKMTQNGVSSFRKLIK